MRLVDADALLSELEKYNDPSAREKNEYLFGMQQRLETCIELVEDAPTVDAVPVVRCKDCIRFSPDDDVWGWCTVSGKMRCKDFCSYGERKDGNDHEP